MNHSQIISTLFIIIAVLMALAVALTVGFMAKLSGDATVIALRHAGVAFTATITVVFLIIRML